MTPTDAAVALDSDRINQYPRDLASKFAISVLLGTTPAQRGVPTIAWCHELSPFSRGGNAWGILRSDAMRPTQEITEDDRIEIERIATVVESTLGNSLDIATRRTISAVGERMEPRDKLIDAVTAWENLVGTNGETVFRVTAALAILLEPDVGKRADFRKRLVEIYGTRSQIVHGRDREPAILYEDGTEAIEVAIAAIRELLEGHPELVGIDDSAIRATHLILGTRPPTN